jgi:fluoroacetyl-CoA thioesterase
MKTEFKEGNTTTRRVTIDQPRTISVAGGEFNVYATPEMIRDIERTCKQYILEFADEGEDSVGTQVNISHVGATLMGMSVEIIATVKTLDRRRIVFDISVKDDLDEVGIGSHDRFITDASKSADKLRAKAEKVGIPGKRS